MAGFTMDVIASTAFGVDLNTQSDLDNDFVKNAGVFFMLPRKGHRFDVLRNVLNNLAMRKCEAGVFYAPSLYLHDSVTEQPERCQTLDY